MLWNVDALCKVMWFFCSISTILAAAEVYLSRYKMAQQEDGPPSLFHTAVVTQWPGSYSASHIAYQIWPGSYSSAASHIAYQIWPGSYSSAASHIAYQVWSYRLRYHPIASNSMVTKAFLEPNGNFFFIFYSAYPNGSLNCVSVILNRYM